MEKRTDLIRRTEEIPTISLFPQIPHNGGYLDCAGFGLDSYANNIRRMQERYYHSIKFPNISFRPATTSETISVLAYNAAKHFLYETYGLPPIQAGFFVKTTEGIFLNPPRDKRGNPIRDGRVLRQYLKSSKKINGIYLLDNDLGFAPYKSFKAFSDIREFTKGGLARVLEHTPGEKAKKVKKILSSEKRLDVDAFNTLFHSGNGNNGRERFGVICLYPHNVSVNMQMPALVVDCIYQEVLTEDLERVEFWSSESYHSKISLCRGGYSFGVLRVL